MQEHKPGTYLRQSRSIAGFKLRDVTISENESKLLKGRAERGFIGSAL